MMKLTDATVRLRSISVNTVHKRCSVAVVAVDNCPFSLTLPDGRKGEDTKRVCTCTLSFVGIWGFISEAETEGTHHLAAVVLNLSGLEVYVVEGIEVAFLS